MPACLICKAPVNPFLSFGQMPIANGFLGREEFNKELFFNLEVGHCPKCHMVQLTDLVDPSILFHENYAYFSSISTRMTQHFKEFADDVQNRFLTVRDPFVVEIGSNDGIMLQNFLQAGIRHLGVEPSKNVAQTAIDRGIQTVVRFFGEETGTDLRREFGAADAILGANVICHLPDIHSVIRGIRALLKDEGVFIFEEPYFVDIVQKISYDQIYDEHVFYFSLTSLGYLFAQHDMEIFDVAPQKVHGGSMRYMVARKGVRAVKTSVTEQLAKETALGLTEVGTYEKLRREIYRSKEQLVRLLIELKGQGHRIVGYGATSKSTTVTNFCGIGPDLIEFISDTTPGKQGKYSPGVHIPVLPYDRFKENYPDYALLFAWNHAEEIMEKEEVFRAGGGKWIVYVPQVKVI
jgi:methylation protein EvaC